MFYQVIIGKFNDLITTINQFHHLKVSHTISHFSHFLTKLCPPKHLVFFSWECFGVAALWLRPVAMNQNIRKSKNVITRYSSLLALDEGKAEARMGERTDPLLYEGSWDFVGSASTIVWFKSSNWTQPGSRSRLLSWYFVPPLLLCDWMDR